MINEMVSKKDMSELLGMTVDHLIGGHWGSHISWWTKGREWDAMKDESFEARAYGHIPWDQQPKEGQIVAGRFQSSVIAFRVKKVKREHDPPDMFWITCNPVKQVFVKKEAKK